MTTERTRLERITVALLASKYGKKAFLQAGELVGMARLIELELDRVSRMTRPEAVAHLRNSTP
jgi:hypothetical protein